MTSAQYEEICRRWIAEQFGLGLGDIRSVSIPNPQRPNLPAYNHQIDLYWETGNSVALYLNIANAKWRANDKIDQGEVLLLQQVRQKVEAHKAFMITTVGFTSGARAAAVDHGIALYLLNPTVDATALSAQDPTAIQAALKALAARSEDPLYRHEIVHRGIDVGNSGSISSPVIVSTSGSGAIPSMPTTAVPAAPTNRSMDGAPMRGDIGGGRGFGPITKK